MFPADKDKFTASIEQTVLHINENEYELASKSVKDALDSFDESKSKIFNTDYVSLLNLAGNISIMTRDTEEARGYFEEALNLDRQSSDACAGLGEIFFIEKNYEGAQAMFQYAYDFNNENKAAVDGLKKVDIMLDGNYNNKEEEITTGSIETRKEFGELFNSMNLLGHGIQIGVHDGEFAQTFRTNWRGKFLHLVDSWSNKEDNSYAEKQHKKLYLNVVNKFSNDDSVFIYKMNPLLAVKQFQDQYFDWIYINSIYNAEDFVDIIENWYSKLKPGGVFACLDFISDDAQLEYETKSRVDGFINNLGAELFFTNDREKKTWYFIKPGAVSTGIISERGQDNSDDYINEYQINYKAEQLSPKKERNESGLVMQAYDLFNTKNFNESLQKLREAEKSFNGHLSNPTNKILAAAFFNLKGFNYLGLNNLKEARLCFEKALNLDPDSSEASAGLGEIFYLSGEDNQAKVMFEFAVHNNPENSFAAEGLKKINAILGYPGNHNSLDKDDKSEIAEKLQQILNSIYELFQLKKFEDALNSLMRTESLFYSQYDEHTQNEIISSFENLKGMVLLALQKTDDAKKAFELALNVNSNSSQACAGLGEVLFLEGQDREAKTMYEWAVKNNPLNQFATEGLKKVNRILGLKEDDNTLSGEDE